MPPTMPPSTTEEEIWFQRPDEPNRWYDRFARYLAAGASRSIRGVYNAERGGNASKAVSASWSQAAQRYEWKRRAEAYDAAERRKIFTHGNALDTERITKLDAVAERMHTKLLAAFDDMPVNDRFVAQYIAVMDMLAKHTGGYAAQRVEHTGKNGGKIEVSEEQTMRVVFYVPEVEAEPETKAAIGDGIDAGSVEQSDAGGIDV